MPHYRVSKKNARILTIASPTTHTNTHETNKQTKQNKTKKPIIQGNPRSEWVRNVV